LPVLFEQRNIRALVIRMAFYFIENEVGADAGPWEFEVSIDNFRELS